MRLFYFPDQNEREIIRNCFLPNKSETFTYYKNLDEICYSFNPNFNLLNILITSKLCCESFNEKIIMDKINKSFYCIFKKNPRENKLHLGRIDYKLDAYMNKENRDLYIKLMKKGYSNYRFLNQENKYKTSLYYKGKSIRLNIYDKAEERLNKKENNLKDYQFLRLEVQVLRPHIRYSLKRNGVIDCISNYYSEAMANYYLDKYLKPVLFNGDYYKLYHARNIIKKNYSEAMACKLINFMAFIGRHGVDKTKSLYGNIFLSYIKMLNTIKVNPIPIPKNIIGFNHVPNLITNKSTKLTKKENYNIYA
jgi:hypothetical protein